MKPLAWIITGILVTVAGALWLQSLPEGSGAPSQGPDGLAVGADADVQDGSQRRPAGAVGAPTGPTLAPHDARVTELRAVMGSGRSQDMVRERELVAELIAEGDEAGIDAVAEAVEDERSYLHADGSRLEQLLRDAAPAASVYNLARRHLDRLASDPDPAAGATVAEVTPWYRLAARNGGPRGAYFVLEQLRSDDPAMAKGAARAAGSLDDPVTRGHVLSALYDDASLSPQVVGAMAEVLAAQAEVLAAQDDELLRNGLFLAALEDGRALDRRAALLLALGRWIDETRLDRYLVLYRSSDEQILREGVLQGLLHVEVSDERMSDSTLDLQLGPFVLELLQDPEEKWAAWGARLIGSVDALHDLDMLRPALEARLAAGTSGTLASKLKAALAALDG